MKNDDFSLCKFDKWLASVAECVFFHKKRFEKWTIILHEKGKISTSDSVFDYLFFVGKQDLIEISREEV